MKTARKAILAVLCVVCIIVATITGTLAYLTDTDSVKNTFTVGNVGLKLDEADVDESGAQVKVQDMGENGEPKIDGDGNPVMIDAPRVQANEYHLLPGHTYVKDPTVTVDAGSDEAYVRMIVEVENIDKLKAAIPDSEYYYTNDMFLLQKLCSEWDPATWIMTSYKDGTKEVTVTDDDGIEIKKSIACGYYEFRYKEIVAKSTSETKLPALFQSITVPGEIDNTHLAHLSNVVINVTAHAIQADGFTASEGKTAADAAWAAFDTQVKK